MTILTNPNMLHINTDFETLNAVIVEGDNCTQVVGGNATNLFFKRLSKGVASIFVYDINTIKNEEIKKDIKYF